MGEAKPVAAANPSPGRRWRRRVVRSLIVLAILAVCLPVALSLYLRVVGGNRLKAAVRDADRDGAWRWDEIQAEHTALPGTQTSASAIDAVAKALPDPWPPRASAAGFATDDSSLLERVRNQDPPVPLGPGLRTELREELAKVSQARAEARLLADRPPGGYPLASPEAYLTGTLPRYANGRRVVSLLYLDVQLLAAEGNLSEALRSFWAMVNIGRALDNDPTFTGLAFRIACRRLSALERIMAQGECAPADLEAVQKMLAAEDAGGPRPLLAAFRGERALQHEMMDWFDRGDADRLAGAGLTGATGVDHWFKAGWLQENHALALEFLNEAVAIGRLPEEEQVGRFEQLDRKVKATRASEWPPGRYALGCLSAPGISRLADAFFRTQAELRCAIVALAVERYRLANGHWPESLDRVTPALLARVPADPYDQERLRFRRVGDALVIYSVGPDRTDNGGALERKSSDLKDKDLGFRLWDVGRRGRRGG